jgi:nicotinamide-nucleotide amidase
MDAVVLSIGDELVSGLTVNTNASWLGAQLTALGIAPRAHVTVGDQQGPIARALRKAAERCELVIVSGGLGPTDDDLTRQALAEALGEDLVEDAKARAGLEAFFACRGRKMSGSNMVQALRPASATCIENTCGTAPGLMAMLGTARVYVTPGVPREMKEMFTRSILPELQGCVGESCTLLGKLNTFGMGESMVGERIKDLMTRGANPAVGTTVHDGVVSVRIYATGARAWAADELARLRGVVNTRLGALVYGEDDDGLEAAVGQLLAARKLTLATAESCTGGLLAQLITDVPGSSRYFLRGWVTYADAAKVEELGVAPEAIARDGAVSEQVARAMATGARERAHADIGVGITGVAGPQGGTPEKPVGTVWLALATDAEVTAVRLMLPGVRAQVRQRAAQMALARLRWWLMGVDAAGVTR